jgi:hypothetical protein
VELTAVVGHGALGAHGHDDSLAARVDQHAQRLALVLVATPGLDAGELAGFTVVEEEHLGD